MIGEVQPGSATAAVPGDPQPVKLKDAAQQFEALILAQMLKTARESSSGGWMGEAEDASGATAMEMGEEQLARLMAAQGGLGLAALVLQGLGDQIRTVPTDK